jgi:hypothetical protein
MHRERDRETTDLDLAFQRERLLPSGVMRQQNWLKGGGFGMLARYSCSCLCDRMRRPSGEQKYMSDSLWPAFHVQFGGANGGPCPDLPAKGCGVGSCRISNPFVLQLPSLFGSAVSLYSSALLRPLSVVISHNKSGCGCQIHDSLAVT